MWSVWTPLSSWTIWCVNVQKVCSLHRALILDSSTVGWKTEEDDRIMESIDVRAVFSPKEMQLLVVSTVGLLVLDAKTGNTPCTFLRHYLFFII